LVPANSSYKPIIFSDTDYIAYRIQQAEDDPDLISDMVRLARRYTEKDPFAALFWLDRVQERLQNKQQ